VGTTLTKLEAPQASRTALHNAAVQIGGRLAMTVMRFLAAGVVIRHAGVETYGEFALVLAMMIFAEAVIDFAMTDVAVRTIAQESGAERPLMRSLVRAKILLAVVASAVFAGAVLAIGYPRHFQLAVLVALGNSLATAVVLINRVSFRARLRMGREVLAELVSVACFVPAVWLCARAGQSLAVLVACFVGARMIFAGLTVLLSTRDREAGDPDTLDRRYNAGWLFRESAVLAASMLLMRCYEIGDPLVISQLLDERALGLYLGAQRFIGLLTMLIYPIAHTWFPLLSAYLMTDRPRFERSVSAVFRLVSFVSLWAGLTMALLAEWLLGLLGADMTAAAPAFRLLLAAGVVQCLMTYLGILIIAMRGHRAVIYITVFAVISKLGWLYVLVPLHGIVGAAGATLGSELGVLLVSVFTLRQMKCRCSWRIWAHLVPALAVTLGLAAWIGGWRNPWLGGAVAAVFPLLLFATRGLTLADLRPQKS